jgi:hypothetical protein
MNKDNARIKIQGLIREIDFLVKYSNDFATEEAKDEFLDEIETAVTALDALEDLIDGDESLKLALK